MPVCTVIPELAYRDVDMAIDWLCEAFGFELLLRVGNHRAQLGIGEGAVVLTERKMPGPMVSPVSSGLFAIMVRVADADRHCERARRCGASITSEPADYPYGERQYSCRDIDGHSWTFSQSIADVSPEDWGGSAV
jgi:uncharacterized glyoxalase superfamily protein PhnB